MFKIGSNFMFNYAWTIFYMSESWRFTAADKPVTDYEAAVDRKHAHEDEFMLVTTGNLDAAL